MTKTKTKTLVAIALVTLAVVGTVAGLTIINKRTGEKSSGSSFNYLLKGKGITDPASSGTPDVGGTTMPFCGDHQQGAGEECDDGNKVSGDGCSDVCKNESTSGSGESKFVGPIGGSTYPQCTRKTITASQALPAGCGVWADGQKYSKVYDENGTFRAYCPDSSGTVIAYIAMGSQGYGRCVDGTSSGTTSTTTSGTISTGTTEEKYIGPTGTVGCNAGVILTGMTMAPGVRISKSDCTYETISTVNMSYTEAVCLAISKGYEVRDTSVDRSSCGS